MRAPNDSSSSTDCMFVFVLLGEERNATTLTFKCLNVLFMSLYTTADCTSKVRAAL